MNGNDDGGRARVSVFGENKSYDRWKQELKAWQLLTNIGKKKQAVTVALSFPEGSEVRGKIFEEVNIEELANGDGMEVLLQHMDKWYKKMRCQQRTRHGQGLIATKEEKKTLWRSTFWNL